LWHADERPSDRELLTDAVAKQSVRLGPPQRSPKSGQWWSPENRPMRT
jgi:hypothetical protein